MKQYLEDRIPEDETPEERAERLRKQNERYSKRSSHGWKHPKDRRGSGQRLFDKFKRELKPGNLRKSMKRDAGFPTIKAEGFRDWLESKENVEDQ